MKSWWTFLAVRALRIALLAYLGMVLLLAGCQRRFIYYPSRLDEDQALRNARRLGLEAWKDADGVLAGWRRPADPSRPAAVRRVLVFHGNAGNALHRIYFVDGFEAAETSVWDVVLFEYPGYGPRPGKPAESTILPAAAAALKQLLKENPEPVFLVGESLGSGPACRLAAEYPSAVAGLWLVTPFTSLADAARIHYPYIPVRRLLRDRYDNVAALQSYKGPLAVLTAGQDRVVPARLGRRLYESAAALRKHWMQQPGADHNTLDLSLGSDVWTAVSAFWMEEGRAATES